MIQADILIVEDDPMMIQLYRRLVNGKYQYDIVYSAEAALDRVKDVDYKLICIDLMLPKMSGHELAVQLIRMGCKASLLFVTAYLDKEMLEMAHEIGAKALAKPINLSELRNIFRRIQNT